MSAPKEPVTKEEFQKLAKSLGFNSVQPQDEEDYLYLLNSAVADLEEVAAMPSYMHPDFKTAAAEERSYTEPSRAENPLNAWRFRTVITSSASSSPNGLLAGKTIAIKDNISIAGVPLTAGTQPNHLTPPPANEKSTPATPPLPYPIPQFDAPVITRVLEAGATITGTSTCENYCMSGLSFTSATGPVDNAWEFASSGKEKKKKKEGPGDGGHVGYSAGGSSSGSAALVAVTCVRRWRARQGMNEGGEKEEEDDDDDDDGLGEGVDFALGGDQGGSIRLPSGYSGIYGLKPTHGLVPYTGCSSLHPAIDHCGPMATSIRDTALLLSVLAGYDGFDPRMGPETPLRNQVPPYHEDLDKAIEARQAAGNWTPETAARGLRIGIIKEAWSAPQLTDEVASTIKRAAERFAALGATVVEEVSIPMHAVAGKIFAAVTLAGMPDVFLHNSPPDLVSWPAADWDPLPDTKTAAAARAEWYETMNKSAPTVVNKLFAGNFLQRDRARFPLAARAKAHTHAHQLRAAYDAALEGYDVLITPATPTVAQRHPDPDTTSVRDKQALALGITYNTDPFNLTGHPGLVIPVGWGQAEGGEGGKLPIGMQLVGKRWGEDKLFLAAAAWEVGGFGLDV